MSQGASGVPEENERLDPPPGGALAAQALEGQTGEEARMWAFITQLLVTLVLLGFFLVSCQNVMHIVRGSLCFVLKHVHQELDKELGENEGLSDDDETISTRVVRRRVLLKVTQEGAGRGCGRRAGMCRTPAGREGQAGLGWNVRGQSWAALTARPTPDSPTRQRRLGSGTWEAGPLLLPSPASSVRQQVTLGAKAAGAGGSSLSSAVGVEIGGLPPSP